MNRNEFDFKLELPDQANDRLKFVVTLFLDMFVYYDKKRVFRQLKQQIFGCYLFLLPIHFDKICYPFSYVYCGKHYLFY